MFNYLGSKQSLSLNMEDTNRFQALHMRCYLIFPWLLFSLTDMQAAGMHLWTTWFWSL